MFDATVPNWLMHDAKGVGAAEFQGKCPRIPDSNKLLHVYIHVDFVSIIYFFLRFVC